ncbi:pimeloyl-ACP methyl ester carboxylesterase [Mycobacterium sp. MAA66]|uniref:alpha/beta fold hydrolase n=1 Tax=Mycobacterium sp. MAA66 TaxID=3156297 RepID=UPI003519616E
MDGRAREWLDAGGHFEWVPSEPMQHAGKLNIFHAEFGDPEAPLILMVHGFPTSSIDWQDVVGELSADHRVCVLDLPGFGFSDKPKGERYTLHRDSELLGYYLLDILGARQGAVVAHDRGDSVALSFAHRCSTGQTPFDVTNLVLSNGNIFLPLSNLTDFQRLVLNPQTAATTVAAITPEMLAVGLGQTTFTPRRALEDPTITALADSFAMNDGLGVIHDTIQYLVERSEHEQEWLEALAAMPVKTTVVWGLYDEVSPLRVAAHVWNDHLATKPGGNEFWLLPRANHYLQNDQPREFVQVLQATLTNSSPNAPGVLSPDPGAPVFLDRSRPRLPTATEALRGA